MIMFSDISCEYKKQKVHFGIFYIIFGLTKALDSNHLYSHFAMLVSMNVLELCHI